MDLKEMEREKFIAFTEKLNDVALSLQDNKEYVSDIEAADAAAFIRDMAIRDAGDALIYCASLNLLNTYVKQKDAKIGYKFKDKLAFYISVINNLHLRDVLIDYQKDKGMNLVVTQIGKIQFSFHNVKLDNIGNGKCNSDHIEWDGIRKQQCALTVFKYAVGNTVCVSNITYRGKNLKERVRRTVENYEKGIVSVEDVLFG